MTASPSQRDGAGWFTTPAQISHRRYEALRAFFVDGLTYQQAADRFGYTRWAMVKASLPAQTTVPWWDNRTLRYEFA